MRAVTLQFNFRASPDMNWSIKTEVLVEDDAIAEEAGSDAAQFILNFQQGMVEGVNDFGGSADE